MPSLTQIAVVVVIVVLLFGRGKISSLMGDLAKGIKSFKKGMATDADDNSPKNISDENQEPNNSENNQDSNNPDNNQDSNNKV